MKSKFNLFYNLIKDMREDQIRSYLYNNVLSEDEIKDIVKEFRIYKSNEDTINYIVNVFPTKYRNMALFMHLKYNDSSRSCIEYIYKHIYNVDFKNFYNLCNIILENGQSVLIYNFALFLDYLLIKNEHIENILKDLEDALIKFNDKKLIVAYAKNIKSANIEKLQDAILQNIKSNDIVDARAINEFKNIEKDGVNFKKLEEGIIQTNNNLEIIEFAKDSRANILRLEQTVLDSDNISCIRLFAGLYNANIKMIDNYFKENQKNGSLGKYAYEFWLKSNEKKGFDVLSSIIKKYFNYEITSIKEGMDIIDNNLFKIIDEIGLVHLYDDLRNLERYNNKINFRRGVYYYLLKIYPERQEILQVYYSFLKGPEYDRCYLELDNEYKEIISSNKIKVKKLD